MKQNVNFMPARVKNDTRNTTVKLIYIVVITFRFLRVIFTTLCHLFLYGLAIPNSIYHGCC